MVTRNYNDKLVKGSLNLVLLLLSKSNSRLYVTVIVILGFCVGGSWALWSSRMAWNSRSSHKHLLLHVWCGLLTVAMLVMAALLISISSKSAQVSEWVKRRTPRLSWVHVAPSASWCGGGGLPHKQHLVLINNEVIQNSKPSGSCGEHA